MEPNHRLDALLRAVKYLNRNSAVPMAVVGFRVTMRSSYLGVSRVTVYGVPVSREKYHSEDWSLPRDLSIPNTTQHKELVIAPTTGASVIGMWFLLEYKSRLGLQSGVITQYLQWGKRKRVLFVCEQLSPHCPQVAFPVLGKE